MKKRRALSTSARRFYFLFKINRLGVFGEVRSAELDGDKDPHDGQSLKRQVYTASN
jgi:hypothetical protein